MPKVLTAIIPVSYDTLVTPAEVALLQPLGLGLEYAIDFALNHWMVLYGRHQVQLPDCVQTMLQEVVHANFEWERHYDLDLHIEKHLDTFIEMLLRIQQLLLPYIGNMPIERAAEVEYICAVALDNEATRIEFGFEDDSVWETA